MPRRRKELSREAARRDPVWRVGRYIRLSREDGGEISESVVNQDKILADELPAFFAGDTYEIVETYIDDGASGTTDIEREAFQRMVHDVETGRINCVAVKNLSRAFRNSANQGRFLEEFIPLYRTRFISLYQPRVDTLLDPESVHSLEVGITGFMNEQYAYKTSCDVRRTLRRKRERGEFVGAFAPFGYDKDPQNRNLLIVDEEAAATVRDIYRWFVRDGMSKAGIARRLNECGAPSPAAHRREKGGGGVSGVLWSGEAVSRILQNPIYIGTLIQGKQRVVSYKVHKLIRTAEDEWAVVENAAPPIVDRTYFDAAQALCRRDTRTPAAKREPYLFAGFLQCADCGRGMTRHAAKGHVYYRCRACRGHGIRLEVLENAVLSALRSHLRLLEEHPRFPGKDAAARPSPGEMSRPDILLRRNRRELERATALSDDAYCDWKSGELSEEQYRRLSVKLEERAARARMAVERLLRESGENGGDGACWECPPSQDAADGLSRGLLAALVDRIVVHADASLDVVFALSDPCRASDGTKRD